MKGTSKEIPWAVAEGHIKIGETRIPCANLDNGERVLTQQGVLRALGRARAAKGGQGASVDQGAAFLRAKNLKPFIDNELLASTKPVEFRPLRGGYTPKGAAMPIAYGFKATAFPDVLKVYVDALNAGVLRQKQEHIGELAQRLLKSLPKVGMIALVDEATGYQVVRDHNELQTILAAYVLPEHRPWIEAIPREFTKELYRVWGWNTSTQRGPRYAGKLTRKLLYEHLPAPVLPRLDELNPADKDTWQRKKKHHTLLTEEIGLQHFRGQLAGVMALLRASPNKRVFLSLFERAFGKRQQQRFPFAEVEVSDLDED